MFAGKKHSRTTAYLFQENILRNYRKKKKEINRSTAFRSTISQRKKKHFPSYHLPTSTRVLKRRKSDTFLFPKSKKGSGQQKKIGFFPTEKRRKSWRLLRRLLFVCDGIPDPWTPVPVRTVCPTSSFECSTYELR